MWVIILCVLYLALHLLPLLMPGQSFWGVDAWSSLPEYMPWIVAAIGVCLVIPAVRKKLDSPIDRAAVQLQKVPVFVWIILAGVLFYLLKQATHFTGDGYLRIRNIESGAFLSPAEPLDTLAAYWFYRLFNPVFGIDGAGAYSWLSIICGIGTLAGMAFYLPSLYPGKRSAGWFTAVAVITAGSSVLFFGYVESYTFLASFTILFLLSGLKMMKDGKFSIAPTLFFGLALSFHPMALLFSPSAIYCYHKVISISTSKPLKWLYAILPPVALFSLVLVIFAVNGMAPKAFFGVLLSENRFLPFLTEDGSYGLASLNHLADYVNLLLLVFPAFVVLPAVFKKAQSPVNQSGRLFLLLSAITGMAWAFVVNPVLGFARDWDMFAVISFPLVLATTFILLEKYKDKLRIVALPLIVAGLAHTLPWIVLNNSVEASLKRAEKLAETGYWSGHAKASLCDELKSYYFAHGNDTMSTAYAVKAYREKPSERFMLSLARQKINNGEFREALNLLEQLSATNYNRKEVVFLLGTLYYNTNNMAGSEQFLKEAITLDKNNYEACFYLAQVYMRTGRVTAATDKLKEAIRIDPNRLEAFTSLGGIYYDSGNTDDALQLFRKAHMLAPGDPGTNYNLALCYASSGDRASALKHLDKAEKSGFDKRTVQNLRKALSAKK